MKICRLMLAVTFLLGGAAPLCAGPIYQVGFADGGTTGLSIPDWPETLESDTPGLEKEKSYDIQDESNPNRVDKGTGFARADQGRLGAAMTGELNYAIGLARVARAFSSFEYDDVVFSSPEDEFIDVTLPLHLSGMHSGSADGWVAASELSVRVGMEGSLPEGLYSINHPDGSTTSSGLLNGLSGTEIDTTIFVTFTNVPTNTPRTLELLLRNSVILRNDDFNLQHLVATLDYSSTFGFVTDGPAFIVPDGVNVNSEQAGIVNNQFTAAQTTPIPEPSSLVLLGIGTLSMFGFGWRRKLVSRRQAA